MTGQLLVESAIIPNFPVHDPLLILKILIAGDQNVEPCVFGFQEKLAVAKFFPSEFGRSDNFVLIKIRSKRPRNIPIEQYLQEARLLTVCADA